jgi:hypothetical protein
VATNGVIGTPGLKWRMGDGHVDNAGATQTRAEVDWDGDDVGQGGIGGKEMRRGQASTGW